MIITAPERLESTAATVTLLADASATGGAASVQRVDLAAGSDGAAPHFHRLSTEIFYVLDGRLRMMIGDEIADVGAGQLAVIAPHTVHAFAADPDHPASVLIVLTPGVERFGYFRLLADVVRGAATGGDLAAAQDEYDNHFVDSPAWRADRARMAGLDPR